MKNQQIYQHKIVSTFRTILSIFIITGSLFSCKHEDYLIPKPNENIRPAADFIKNNYDFRLFYTALEYTDLINDLNGAGPFTVLAINDAGFNGVGVFTPEDIHRLDRDSLRHALQYHVLKDRRLLTTDIPTNAVDVRYETLSGDRLFTSAGTRTKEYYFDGSKVTRSDIILSNGVLHVVDKIMKYHKDKNIQTYLAEHPDYSIFVAGLKKFGLWDELLNQGPFTIFAPTNDAFKDKGVTTEVINQLNTTVYNKRLFSSYIMYNKHYFVSDKQVFYIISNEYNYRYILKDDDWYVLFGALTAWPEWELYPTLTLWKPFPGRSYDDIMGTIDRHAKTTISDYDHRFENGLLHKIHGLLILPEQALN